MREKQSEMPKIPVEQFKANLERAAKVSFPDNARAQQLLVHQGLFTGGYGNNHRLAPALLDELQGYWTEKKENKSSLG